MLRGERIVCFAPDPWSDIWRNRHQIMSLLAQENRVLYVEPRPYLRTVARQMARGQISVGCLFGERLRAVGDGLHVYQPPLYAPLSGQEPVKSLTARLRAHDLRRAMRRAGVERPLLWLYRPDMDDLPGCCDERLLIYHMVDEYAGYADVSAARAETVRARERRLIARADLVLVSSRALLEHKGGLNPRTYWVPNAVDYPRFAAAAAARHEPPELAGCPRPRLGYVGAINDKLDTDLLLDVARAHQQATLVLVGPVRPATDAMRAGLAALHDQPNVRWVDQVPVERVPEFVAACDVGLLPYRRNLWTEHIQPLKLYEYLACGLPVVATDIPAVRDEAAVVAIASDAEQYVALIAEALRGDSGARRAERQARAARNTWRQRVAQISELIEAALGDRARR
ncbi:MAG: glycosyltransferase [Chloroflexota bacterium]